MDPEGQYRYKTDKRQRKSESIIFSLFFTNIQTLPKKNMYTYNTANKTFLSKNNCLYI